MDGVSLFFDRPLSPKRAMERARLLWREGDFEWSAHAEKRLIDRDLDNLDVDNIIRYGRVIGHSRPDNGWRYEIEGRTVENKKARCIVEINKTLVIVTVIV